MAEQIYIVVDQEGAEIGTGTRDEIVALSNDGYLPPIETLTLLAA